MNALIRLREINREFARRCTAARWFAPLFYVGTEQHLIAEAEKAQAKTSERAYSAEQADMQAIKLLDEAAADGLSQADMPAIAAAIRHIRNSAKCDRQIQETIAV